MGRQRSPSGTATVMNTTASTSQLWWPTGWKLRARRRTAPMWKLSRSATIPGSSGASSIRSSNHAPSIRIRCLRRSLERRWRTAASARWKSPNLHHPQASLSRRVPSLRARGLVGDHILRPGIWSLMKRPVRIGRLTLAQGNPLFLIAGPCVIESHEHALMMARRLAATARRLGVPYIFKASFDKANRTSASSYRGPGLDRGLQILAAIRKQVGVPVLTDIHEAGQAAPAAQACDVLQIPAFLCRQTDLLEAAGSTGAVVNIKKGQFMSPWDMRFAVEKIERTGNRRIVITERGNSFGYNNLVVDMR